MTITSSRRVIWITLKSIGSFPILFLSFVSNVCPASCSSTVKIADPSIIMSSTWSITSAFNSSPLLRIRVQLSTRDFAILRLVRWWSKYYKYRHNPLSGMTKGGLNTFQVLVPFITGNGCTSTFARAFENGCMPGWHPWWTLWFPSSYLAIEKSSPCEKREMVGHFVGIQDATSSK